MKKISMNAWESHAMAEECVWMRLVAFTVTALLDSLGLCVKSISILMTALESTVATGEGV